MPSSTSAPGYSDPRIARDAEELPPAPREQVYGRGLLWLVIAVFAGPIVWFLDLQIAYMLVYHACHTRNLAPLYVETILAMALVAGGISLSWRLLSRFPDADQHGGQPEDRARVMAFAGLGLGVLFFVVLIAAAVPRFVLDPCP
jgi:hypothetical protein